MKSISVMIGTADPKILGEFYTKVLGKPGWQQDDWYGFWTDNGGMMIGSHSEVKGKNKEPARSIINFTVEDVKGEFERIKALGAEVVAEPYQPSADKDNKVWLATFADPDGNYFQLASPWDD